MKDNIVHDLSFPWIQVIIPNHRFARVVGPLAKAEVEVGGL